MPDREDQKPSEEFLHIAEDIGRGMRLDANETTVLARSLEQSAVRAVEHQYPALKARQLAPMLEGIDPGAETFTWHESRKVGKAEIIAAYGDDLPSVGHYLTENTGKIRTIGTSFEYSTADLRRVAKAAAQGLHMTLDPRPTALADEFIERKVDDLAASGDATYDLPGMLNNSDVEGLGIQAASGNWASGGASPADIVSDLRKAVDAVAVDSEGTHSATTIVMPIAQMRYLASTPLLGTGDNRLTILQDFLQAENAAGNANIQIVDWTKCKGAGAGAVDRCVVYQRTSDVLGLVNPMRSSFLPPQASGLHWSVPVESRCGGVVVFKPLAMRYIDGI